MIDVGRPSASHETEDYFIYACKAEVMGLEPHQQRGYSRLRVREKACE
jgi:hypothetical protein